MTWSKTVPTTATKVIATESIFQSNYDAMDSILAREHYGMTDAFSGRHKPGYIGSVWVSAFSGTYTGIANPATGAILWDTGSGKSYGVIRTTQDTWTPVHSAMPSTRVIASVAAAGGTFGSLVNSRIFSGGNESIDSLGEWSTGSGAITPSAAGYFLCSMTVAASTTLSATDRIYYGFIWGSNGDYTTGTVLESAYQSFNYTTMISAASGVVLYPFVQGLNSTFSISGGTKTSYCSIFRVS